MADGRDPADQDGFAAACVRLEAVLADPGAYPDETARELYSELCEVNAGNPARMALLRPLGERLHALEREGILPRAMVVRSRRRRE